MQKGPREVLVQGPQCPSPLRKASPGAGRGELRPFLYKGSNSEAPPQGREQEATGMAGSCPSCFAPQP